MKRFIFSMSILFMISGCIVSCSTEGTDNCPEDFTGALTTNEEKLVGTWQLTAIDAEDAVDISDDDTENPSTDLFAQYSDCQKDADYTFGSDRSYTYTQGQNETDCPNKAALGGSWQISSNTLRFVYACNVQNLVIIFNGDETEFSFSDNFTITDVDGNNVVTDITFTYSLVP